MATYNNAEIAKLFQEQARARQAANAMGFAQQEQQAASALAQQGQQYDALRNQAYVNARLSALGNNEGLAAAGLAGNAYAAPQSGYSETSRIRQDTALGNALNALNTQQQGAATDIQAALTQARGATDANWLNTQADLQARELAAQQSAYQTELGRQQSEAQLALSQQSQALQKAQMEMQMFGKVMTQESANALGVPIGTALKTSGGGGGGRSGGGGGDALSLDALADLFAESPTQLSNHTPGYNTGVKNTPTAQDSYNTYQAALQEAARKRALEQTKKKSTGATSGILKTR